MVDLVKQLPEPAHFLKCDACGSEMWDNPNRLNTRCLRKPKGKDCHGRLRRHRIAAAAAWPIPPRAIHKPISGKRAIHSLVC